MVADHFSSKSSIDEEKARTSNSVGLETHSRSDTVEEVEKPPAGPPKKGVFSWQHISYRLAGGKLLLNNVSGFVAPGKLTALMGESGAGKVFVAVPPVST